jgi:hypothetical protein
MSLAVFDISKVVENGVEITPMLDPTSGTVRYVAHLIVSVILSRCRHSQPPQSLQVLY